VNTFATSTKITTRKQHHIDVCRAESGQEVESSLSAGFHNLKFVHTALPEMSWDEIETKSDFLGQSIAFPFFISCMTGGSEEGYQANRELAKAAQQANIPIGLGSMRVLLEDPSRLKDFRMKEVAPDVPVLANLGAVQLRELSVSKIKELIQSVEADALVIHLNCGQELFQSGGDRDFTGLYSAIGKFVDESQVPLIVKETGFGIRPAQVKKLLELGVEYVDLAGAGGTNWALVEERCREQGNHAGMEFADWGIPTAVLLESTRCFSGRILASGGLRSGMDLAKSLALGALAGGMALPLFQAALKGGADEVSQKIEEIHYVLKSTMLLTGCRTLDELRKVPLLKSSGFEQTVESLKKIDEI